MRVLQFTAEPLRFTNPHWLNINNSESLTDSAASQMTSHSNFGIILLRNSGLKSTSLTLMSVAWNIKNTKWLRRRTVITEFLWNNSVWKILARVRFVVRVRFSGNACIYGRGFLFSSVTVHSCRYSFPVLVRAQHYSMLTVRQSNQPKK